MRTYIIIFVALATLSSTLIGSATTSFTESYKGYGVVFTGTTTLNMSDSGYHKWNVSENDGIYNGSTGWISGNITTYVYTFHTSDSITVTLYVKNATTNESYELIVESFYSPERGIESFDFDKTIPMGTGVEPGIPKNPWNPWFSFGGEDISPYPVTTVLIMIFVIIILGIAFSNRQRKEVYKIGDYVVEYITKYKKE